MEINLRLENDINKSRTSFGPCLYFWTLSLKDKNDLISGHLKDLKTFNCVNMYLTYYGQVCLKYSLQNALKNSLHASSPGYPCLQNTAKTGDTELAASGDRGSKRAQGECLCS